VNAGFKLSILAERTCRPGCWPYYQPETPPTVPRIPCRCYVNVGDRLRRLEALGVRLAKLV
jgi:hypothetical protein